MVTSSLAILSGCRNGGKVRLTLLSTAELLNLLLFVHLGVEGYLDAHSSVVLDTISVLLIRVFRIATTFVGLPFDDQAAASSGDQTLEDLRELL